HYTSPCFCIHHQSVLFPQNPSPHGSPRFLHPFPTRRSSDLFTTQLAALTAREETVEDHPELRDLAAELGGALTEDAIIELNGMRSEEHTSELQSRENLVCRLLLEKK